MLPKPHCVTGRPSFHKSVYHLVKERGLTLAGAKQQFKLGGPKETAETNSEVIDRLKAVKEELLALKEQLDNI